MCCNNWPLMSHVRLVRDSSLATNPPLEDLSLLIFEPLLMPQSSLLVHLLPFKVTLDFL